MYFLPFLAYQKIWIVDHVLSQCLCSNLSVDVMLKINNSNKWALIHLSFLR